MILELIPIVMIFAVCFFLAAQDHFKGFALIWAVCMGYYMIINHRGY